LGAEADEGGDGYPGAQRMPGLWIVKWDGIVNRVIAGSIYEVL